MIGEWCYINKRFTPDFCKNVLDLGLSLPFQAAALGVDGIGSKVDDTYRRSNIRFIEKQDQRFEFLYDEMWKDVIGINDEWFNVHISKLDYIQLAEYTEQQQGEYKRHHDVFWVNGDPKYHRKLSAVIQLSDPADYDGGDLQFFDVNESPNPEYIRNQGSIVFFPSFIHHGVSPVTRGTRHSLTLWFDGPKWK